MICKVKDINKEQVITALLHLPHLIYMSHLWHTLLCNQLENVIHIHNDFHFVLVKECFLTLDKYEVKIPKARHCTFTVNGAIKACGLLVKKSLISYCTAETLAPQ